MINSMTARCVGFVAARQAQIIILYGCASHVWYEVYVLTCCVWFSPKTVLCIMVKQLLFVLVCSNSIVLSSLLSLMVYSHSTLQS